MSTAPSTRLPIASAANSSGGPPRRRDGFAASGRSERSSGRPAHGPPTEQMQVQMGGTDCPASVADVVTSRQPPSRPSLPGDDCRHGEQAPQVGPVGLRRGRPPTRCAPRHQQEVVGRLRMEVPDGEDEVILVDAHGGDLALGDTAEQAISAHAPLLVGPRSGERERTVRRGAGRHRGSHRGRARDPGLDRVRCTVRIAFSRSWIAGREVTRPGRGPRRGRPTGHRAGACSTSTRVTVPTARRANAARASAATAELGRARLLRPLVHLARHLRRGRPRPGRVPEDVQAGEVQRADEGDRPREGRRRPPSGSRRSRPRGRPAPGSPRRARSTTSA